MSTFAVTVEQIGEILPHPNADRLEIATLDGYGYRFIVAKDVYKPGDYVVYFPVDSVLPENLIENLGLTGKLSGKQKNRVKTIRLRGEISQGVVVRLWDCFKSDDPDFYMDYDRGMDLTELLGVTKYEVPEVDENRGLKNGGIRRSLPQDVYHYDLEGAQHKNALDIIEKYLMNTPVAISEKVEGTHVSVTLYADGKTIVCSRNFGLEPIDGQPNTWIDAINESGIVPKLPHIMTVLGIMLDTPVYSMTLRGEIVGPGIQKNIYKLEKNEVYFFELEVNGKPVDFLEWEQISKYFGIQTVPYLSIGKTLAEWLNGQDIPTASNGNSVIKTDILREGIVIRPLMEIYNDVYFERVIFKMRSPLYLSESDL